MCSEQPAITVSSRRHSVYTLSRKSGRKRRKLRIRQNRGDQRGHCRLDNCQFLCSMQVRAKIQQAIGPHEDLLTIVKRRKLQWYGRVSRSSGLAKTILQGTVKGGRRQGDRGRGGKTTSGNGQAWSSPSPRGQWRTGKNGENWLQNYLWCPNDLRG